MRTLIPLAIAALATLAIVAACGDDDSGERRAGVTPSCDELSTIDSYRYTLNIMLDSPAFTRDDPDSTDAPLGDFADALAALFSDLQLEGAYVAPDRTQVVLEFEGEELEWRAIGDQGWVRFGDEWEEQTTPNTDSVLTPEIVCEDIVSDLAGTIEDAEAEEETVNGIETLRYSLGQEDIVQLPELLGGDAIAEIPEDIQFDVWLSKEGLWLVKLNVSATDRDEDGEPVELSLEMELLDVNDEEITIEPPELD